jgi:hypothetical protein
MILLRQDKSSGALVAIETQTQQDHTSSAFFVNEKGQKVPDFLGAVHKSFGPKH